MFLLDYYTQLEILDITHLKVPMVIEEPKLCNEVATTQSSAHRNA